MMFLNDVAYHLWMQTPPKNNTSLIFAVPEISDKICRCVWDAENRRGINFLMILPQQMIYGLILKHNTSSPPRFEP